MHSTAILILRKSFVYFTVLASLDVASSLVLSVFLGVSSIPTTFGYIALVEMALLFIIGGLLDAWQSGSGVAARRLLWKEGPSYSAQRHRDAQKKGAALILAGIWFVVVALLFFTFNI